MSNTILLEKESKNQAPFLVYNASAGSGKTFTLVLEYLKVILSSKDFQKFEQVLAITFTNKASAEMKDRIINSLYDLSKGKDKNYSELLCKQLSLDPKELEKKASKILDLIMNNYSGLSIMTIDSFTLKLIKNFSYELKLPTRFELELDLKNLKDKAVDLVIDKIGGTDKDLTNFLIKYALEDKSNQDKSWNISFDLKKHSEILFSENHIKPIKELYNLSLYDFNTIKTNVKNYIKSIEKGFESIAQKAIDLIDSNKLKADDFSYSDLPSFFKKFKPFNLKNINLFVPYSGRLYKNFVKGVIYPKKTPKDTQSVIDTLTPDFYDLYTSICDYFEKHFVYSLIFKNITSMAMLKYVFEELQVIKKNQSIGLNAEFNKMIYENIKDQPANFIYERIGENFKHFFIDEMQDTSGLQWANLIPLIDNAISVKNTLSKKGSLLLVGDAKQSIYQWRGGDPQQFIDLSKEQVSTSKSKACTPNIINPFKVEKKVNNLDTNYRSYSEIINFNNAFFTHCASIFYNEDHRDLYVIGNKQMTNDKKGGYVCLEYLNTIDSQEEKGLEYPIAVLRTIEEIKLQFDYKDICIITRKNNEASLISDYLINQGIPVISSECLLLKNNAKVNCLVNLLTYFAFPSNLDAKTDAFYFLHTFLNIPIDKHFFLEKYIFSNFKNFESYLKVIDINFSHDEFIKMPLYESIEYLMKSFHFTDKVDAYMQFFLDVIIEYCAKKPNNIASFLSYWKEKENTISLVVPNGQNAVNVMTIHKSKGLEFPVVIFPCNLDIYKQNKKVLWYDVKGEKDFGSLSSCLIDFKEDLKNTTDKGKLYYYENRSALELENLNLLYVALTRPQEQLYLITIDPNQNKKNKDKESKKKYYSTLYESFLNESSYYKGDKSDNITKITFGNPKRISKKSSTTQIKNKPLEVHNSSIWSEQNVKVLCPNSHYYNTNRINHIEFGNLVHSLAENIYTEKDIDIVLGQALFEGKIDIESHDYIRRIWHNLVSDKRLKMYFDKGVEILNEQPIWTPLEDKKISIPDRLIILPNNHVVIIDYKTGESNSEYKKQIVHYALLLEEMGYTVDNKYLIYIKDPLEIVAC